MPRLIAGGAVHDFWGPPMLSGATRSQCKPPAPTIARYNQTLLPFLPTRPTSAVALFLLAHSRSHSSRSLAAIFHSFRVSTAACPTRCPTGFLQYIPWLRIFHKRTYRRIPILPHPAAFSVTCTTTLPLRLVEINTPTRSGDEACPYCLRRQLRLHCVCR